jgi:hypothetical protein
MTYRDILGFEPEFEGREAKVVVLTGKALYIARLVKIGLDKSWLSIQSESDLKVLCSQYNL